MRSPFIPVILACALFATAGAALAKPARGERLQAELQQRFARGDGDGDGRLSAEEAEAGMPFVSRHFAAIDTKGQGSVSLKQVGAFARERMARRKGDQ
ncbi:EF-hand domain-containing protein [Azotobacter armeniacus]